ncbi:MAG TPA: phage tail sheath C-terminal domain-containing protein [Bryobacteraceae bacterium]|nr:phage tail sheath C-terminal domain-containing protein [Bryobacteraceae bacterium]
MPEYLSPGVYIEEVPSSLKAIEGVSTSTAAFVGRADRGTVPGYVWPLSTTPTLPFTPTGGFVLTEDPSPVLVTSLSEFQREFGLPLTIPTPSDPTDYGYLGWAAKAFFDNGGKRVYIARIVDPRDTPSTLRTAQGVAYRLLRSTLKTDKTIFLTSTRGLNIGDAITFIRHSDGQNALGTPDLGAIADGGSAPFALQSGDSIKVTSGGSSVTGTWTGTAASVKSTAGTATFAGLPGTTLQLRIGGPSSPQQNITFTGDAVTPLSAPPTLAEVSDFLSKRVLGASVFFDAGAQQLTIETDAAGTSAQLTVGGTAVGPLTLLAVTPGGGNVADIGQVTIAEIAAQLILPGKIAVGDNGAGALRIASVATGAAASVTLDEQPAGSGALSRLGYGSVATLTKNGSTGISPSITITAYDSKSSSISFGAAVGVVLDPNDAYGVVTAAATNPVPNAGPQFYARSPGDWSAGVQVQISSSDRQPSPILGGATIATGATQLKVQNVSGFYVGGIVEIDYSGTGRSSHEVTKIDSGTRQLTIDPPTANPINPAAATTPLIRTLEVDVIVIDTTGASPTETYKGMSWNQTAGVADVRRHYAWTINANSSLVWVQPPGIGSPPLSNSENFNLTTQPTTADGFPMNFTSIGAETLNDLDDTWVGVDNGPGARSGIQSLLDLTEPSIIAAPGKTSATIQLALIDQCELLRYRFAILDGERDPAGGSITSILNHRSLYDTSFAGYYQPFVTVSVDGQNQYLPSSGYLAGIYARVDNTRGVWKAPANEVVQNVIALKTNFTTGEQDVLNPVGVNLIRRFETEGIRVWGGRTLSSDPDVRYINVRRTLIFIEASIDRGTQWVVFEPNDPTTWSRVTDSVSAFLLTQWRAGALFGRKPEQAFFVRCDETTMTADDILNGRLICEIGVAIVRPAEFVIFRIQQITDFGAAQ